jgi:hypothetical protein
MRILKTSLLATAAAILCLIGASPANAGPAGNGDSGTPVRLSPGDQWTLGKTTSGEQRAGVQKAGEMGPQASGWGWICRGTFAAPDLSSVGGFSWGALQQCTSSLAQQVSVKVNLCVQDPGGPSHFHCDVYKGGRKGDLVHATQARTNATVSGCNRSKYSTYVQVAYSIMADYQYYPSPVESNQTEIRCGF